MNKFLTGKIPEDITVYLKPAEKVSQAVSDEDILKVDAVPGFVFETGNKKTEETAKSWAFGYCNDDFNKESFANRIVVKKNVPVSGYHLIGLEIRSEGGRAWKVLDSNGHLFDLREDVLLDILQYAGVENGIIKADLIWAVVGSQMKLIRVGSELHKRILAYTVEKGKQSIKDLVIGHVYSTPKGQDNYVFIGRYDAVAFSKEKAIKYHKGFVFYKIKEYSYDGFSYQKEIDECNYFKVVILKTYNLVKDVGTVIVPDNFLDRVRKNYLDRDSLKDYPRLQFLGYENYKKPNYWISDSSFLFNMEGFTDKPIEDIDEWNRDWYSILTSQKKG